MVMTLVFQFLKDNWKSMLVGLVIVGMVMYVEGLRVDNANLHTQIVTLTGTNKILTDNNTKLQGAIDVSNKAFEITNTAAANTSKNFDAVKVSIQQQTSDLKQHLNALLVVKDPVTCNDAILFLISNAKGYVK